MSLLSPSEPGSPGAGKTNAAGFPALSLIVPPFKVNADAFK